MRSAGASAGLGQRDEQPPGRPQQRAVGAHGALFDLQAPARLRDLLLSDPLSYRSAFLPVMAHETGGELLWVSLTNDLRKAFLDVVSRFNRRYLLSYTPTGVAESGWHPIEVTVKDKTLEVTARRGYQR